MNIKASITLSAAQLRRRAEDQLRQRKRNRRNGAGTREPDADPQRLQHELQVHQVELEMQNTELQLARDRMEPLLEKFTDLYDFAPVGYFSLDEQGRIQEVNLTGAALLGAARSRLLEQPLQRFVPAPARPVFLAFLKRTFAKSGKQICEATLQQANGPVFWADFHAMPMPSLTGAQKWCRVAVSDITPLKRAEEAQRRLEVLSVSNLELRREIIRREAVEKALSASQRQLGRLLEKARATQSQLRQLSHEILHAQEEERKRISRELHDEITQTLILINVHLQTLSGSARITPATLKRKIAETQLLVEQSVEVVHQFARELRPTALDDLGLMTTLHAYLKDFMKRTGIRVHFTTFTTGRIRALDNALRTVFYRVSQEALSNVAQHAKASRVDVAIRKLLGNIQLEIADNGQAFDVGRVLQIKRNKRLGLIGMRERVEMVGGRFEIESLPGKGTTIRVTIPTAKARAGSDKNPKQETSFACHRFDCPRRLVKDSLLEPVQTQP
jgi:PAS domain S-box-containing protein